MSWKKLGRIHKPGKQFSWNQKYSILPVPEYIPELDIIRVYFGTTDHENNGRVSYIEVSASEPTKILYEHDDYVLGLGNDGMFDDSGVVPSSLIYKDDETLMYTVGFQRCVKVPYMLFAGLAKAKSNKPQQFQRVSEAPILPRTEERPVSQGAPCVIFEDGIYKMWHWYGTKWIEVDGKPFIDYHIGYALSEDGVHWDMQSRPCLAPKIEEGEFAVARPWVIKLNGRYHMWYSTRFKQKMYRISYATSDNGVDWERSKLNCPPNVSSSGWDSEMVCYPAVIEVGSKLLMFYNGNSNGETGFGIAEMNVEALN